MRKTRSNSHRLFLLCCANIKSENNVKPNYDRSVIQNCFLSFLEVSVEAKVDGTQSNEEKHILENVKCSFQGDFKIVRFKTIFLMFLVFS
jgi:hypothetical protein